MEFPGGGGSTARPSGTENPGGWGGQTGKTLRGGGMDIFWNHTFPVNSKLSSHFLVACRNSRVHLSNIYHRIWHGIWYLLFEKDNG